LLYAQESQLKEASSQGLLLKAELERAQAELTQTTEQRGGLQDKLHHLEKVRLHVRTAHCPVTTLAAEVLGDARAISLFPSRLFSRLPS
jgi:hypothetical protein